MIDEKDKKWRELTFSQREGKVSLPEPLQAGKLTDKFKTQIWYFIEESIENCTGHGMSEYFLQTDEGKYWRNFLSLYTLSIFEQPHDRIKRIQPYELKRILRNMIFQKENHKILTLLEYILRLSSTPRGVAINITGCFEFAPYAIDTSGTPVCIISTTSSEMKENVKRSLENINESTLVGAKSHFQNSSQEINNNNFSASIRESIHAIEAAARQIDPRDSSNINAALDSLERDGMLKHPVLREAFKKLYAYASDEEGIRHPLIEKEAADVGFDEAIFMYGACVSFVDYLASKYRQKEEK